MADGDSSSGGGSDILGFTSSPYAQGGALALGGMSDIWSFIRNMQKQNALRNVYQILQDPSKLSAYAGALMPQYSPQAMGVFNRGVNADWASLTGGAPGGAAAQFGSDAWAKLISQNWQTALQSALGGLGEASGTATRYATPGIGGLGSVANALKILSQLRTGGQGQTPGIASGFPGASGAGGDYAGSSDFLRSGGSFPAPVTFDSGVAA